MFVYFSLGRGTRADELVKKPLFSPMVCFVAGLARVVLGTLIRFRALPFLHSETILSAGRLVPTQQWAAFMSRFFYFGSAVMVAVGLITLFMLSEANRRYIAQLPPMAALLDLAVVGSFMFGTQTI
jgi:hypothetical protein